MQGTVLATIGNEKMNNSLVPDMQRLQTKYLKMT